MLRRQEPIMPIKQHVDIFSRLNNIALILTISVIIIISIRGSVEEWEFVVDSRERWFRAASVGGDLRIRSSSSSSSSLKSYLSWKSSYIGWGRIVMLIMIIPMMSWWWWWSTSSYIWCQYDHDDQHLHDRRRFVEVKIVITSYLGCSYRKPHRCVFTVHRHHDHHDRQHQEGSDSWSIGGWGPCSATCGEGVRTRRVECPQGGWEHHHQHHRVFHHFHIHHHLQMSELWATCWGGEL